MKRTSPHLPTVVDQGETTVQFSSPAEIFGVDGIIILIVVVLVLFGSTQIPKLARSLGSAQKEFKKGIDEGSSEDGIGKQPAAQAAPVVVNAPAQTTNVPAHATVTVESRGVGSSHTTP